MGNTRRVLVGITLLASALHAVTTIDLGAYQVAEGQAVDIRVAVTGNATLLDLNMRVVWDPAALEFVPGSLWVSADRITNVYLPGTIPGPEEFLSIEPSGDRVFFWLQRNAEIGDAGWRISAVPAGSPIAALFGFSLRGVQRGSHGLGFPAGQPPVARNTHPVYWDEEEIPIPGSVLVYRPAGPVQIVPPGGSFAHAVEVAVTSADALRIVYTLDGTEPGAGSPELPLGEVLFLDGADGQTIPLRVLAFGEAGSTASGAASFAFDKTAPVVTVTPQVTSAGKPVLSGTVSEPAAAVRVSVAGASGDAVNAGDGTWSLDLATLFAEDIPEGVYDVAATATDPAGNSAADGTAGELTIDRTPPQGAFTIGPGDPAFVGSTGVALAVSVTGAAEMRFRNRGEEWGGWQPLAAALPWVLPDGDGNKTVDGEFRDLAGNRLALSDSVGLDTGLPGSAIVTAGPYGPLNWPGEVAGTAADAYSGVARVEVQCERSDTGECWSGTGWAPGQTWVTASGTTAWSLGLAGDAIPEGPLITVRSRAVDRAGNVQSPEALSQFTYDGTPPSGAFSIETPETVAVPRRDVTLRNAVTGADRMRFREGDGDWTEWVPFAASWPWTLADADGRRTVYAQFEDAAGNRLAASDAVLLDRAAPACTVTTAGGYGPASWPGFAAGTAADATSGVQAVAVLLVRQAAGGSGPDSWDGSAWSPGETWLNATLGAGSWSVPLPLNALEEGGDGRQYEVYARAADLAGNLETPPVQSVFVFDSRIPAGGFTIGAGNPLFLNTTSVELHCAVTAPNPLVMRFRTAAGSFPEEWQPYAETVPFVLPSGDGLKKVFGEFRDTVSGNVLATSDTVTLDTGLPVCAIATAGTFGPLTWPGEISGTASDTGPSGPARVDLRILRGDGLYWTGTGWQASPVQLAADVAAGAWALPLAAGALGDGFSYTVIAQAVDGAGNRQEFSASSTFSYDSTPPAGQFTIGPGDPAATGSRDVTLAIAVTGAVEMAFRNSGGAWSAWEPVAAQRPWQLVGGDGAKQVSGRFRDAVGNLFEASDSILFDSTPPTSTVSAGTLYGPSTWPGRVTGTAADGLSGVARVEVRVQRASDGFSWDGGDWQAGEIWLAAVGTVSWEVPLAAASLQDGLAYTVSARAVDVAGNAQPTPSVAFFTFDAGLPTSSFTTPVLVGLETWPGHLGGTASDAIAGVAGVEVKLLRVLQSEVSFWDGAAWQPGLEAPWLPAQGTASWVLPLPLEQLSDGASYTATCRATDAVGNRQSPPATRVFAFDGTPPAAPVLDSIEADTGLPDDWVTSDRTLVISGRAEAGCTVTVSLGGTPAGTAPVDAGGNWRLDYTGHPLADGTLAVQAAAVDPAGNHSPPSAARTLVIDTLPPVVTCLLAPGTATNGSLVIVFASEGLGAASASVDQTLWGDVRSGVATVADVPGFADLPQGPFTLYLRDADLAGNMGRTQAALSKDTIPPGPITAALSQPYVNAANCRTVTLSITGAETGTTCHYEITPDARSAVTGSFPVTAPAQTSPPISVEGLPDGWLTVRAFLRDAVGNDGPAASSRVQKDTVAPAGYTVQFASAFVNAANQSAAAFLVPGGEAGAACHYAVTSSGGGAVVSGSLTIPGEPGPLGPLDLSGPGDGTLTLSVYLTDPAGNSGGAVWAQVPKDTVAPAVPVVESLTDPVNAGTVGAVGFGGRSEPGSTVSYQLASSGGGMVEGTVLAGGDGRFEVSGLDVSGLGDGTLTLTVQAHDPAGNQSPAGPGGTALKDTVAPEAPVLTEVMTVINAATAVQFGFRGTAEPGAEVDYTLAPAGRAESLSGTLPVGPDGAFVCDSLDTGGLPDGTLSLRLGVRDPAGNAGPQIESGPIRKDTALPELELLSPAAGPVSGDEVFRFTVSEPCAVRGALPGEGWLALADGVTTVQDLPGFAALAEGPFSVTIAAEDEAGNTTAREYPFVKDTVPPSGYTVAFPDSFVDGSAVDRVEFDLFGAEPGTAFAFVLRDAATPAGTVLGGGTVTEPDQRIAGVPLTGLAQGTLTVTLVLTDRAGNAGPEAAAQTTLGTTLVVTLVPGWNAFGCTVAPIDSTEAILAEAAGRDDGALVRGPLHGWEGGAPTALTGEAVPGFARAYVAFAARAGTLRVRGVAGAGLGDLPPGWTYAAAGTDVQISELPAAWSVWTDAFPASQHRRLLRGAVLPAGVPVWVYAGP